MDDEMVKHVVSEEPVLNIKSPFKKNCYFLLLIPIKLLLFTTYLRGD